MISWGADADFVFNMPTRILFGAGTHREIGAEVSDLGCTRAILVTDRALLENTDVPARVQKALGAACVAVFADVEPDSRVEIVDRGAAFAAENGADCLVSVGGGSCMDTAKAIAVVMACGGSIRDHFAVNALSGPATPHIAVPTTAGTGSEVTNVALVKDAAASTKFFILDNHLFPRTAVLDPTLTVGLPPGLTAATGMDALTHAIEAITSICRNAASHAFAVQAVRMISGTLKTAVQNPADLDARGTLLSAATLAGAAFSNSMVGLVHAIAHTLGGVCSLHHGLANSIMLPHVMRFNAEMDPAPYAPVIDALGGTTDDLGQAGTLESVQAAADRLTMLASECGLYTRLRDTGVERSALPDIADRSLSDGAIINNFRPITDVAEVLDVLEKAY